MPFPGSCPQVKTLKSFNLERFMGTWYEYSRYPNVVELFLKCQKFVYKNETDGSISVVNTGNYVLTNNVYQAIGKAKPFAAGELQIVFQDENPDTFYNLILGTDYNNWVVIYSCKVITSFRHTKMLWTLTRERQPSEEVIAATKQVIADNNIPEIFLVQSSQTECPNDDDQD